MRHVYVHVPFCARRCSYCDFAIAVRRRVPARDYVEAIRRELDLGHAARGPGAGPEPGVGSLETLYLGGGTPSRLPPVALAALVQAVRPAGVDRVGPDDLELTLEANPDDVTVEHATAWRRAGVNRVSLGAQSFDDRVLKWMHRTHDAARIGQAVAALRAAGIVNLSLDLIFALPTELERDWARDLEHALALAPLHLSLYGLTVEERTPLARWISRGRTAAPDDERYAAEYLLAHERLGREGYHFYEVSNATRPGGRSRHNSVYWSGRPYVGLGPAAHSFDGRARRWNLPAWEAYRRALALGRSPVASEEVLTPSERELERVYCALRTDAGLLVGPGSPLPAPIERWVRAGWAAVQGDRVVLSPEGWLRLDALVGDLTGAQETS
ncbi:MAG TPA: radical SAM family heme chaperone HemW [Gemmatimonadales bacterium]|nr:radical SAM family heme chaperone HemW [Gemmatimonadales bacterium]